MKTPPSDEYVRQPPATPVTDGPRRPEPGPGDLRDEQEAPDQPAQVDIEQARLSRERKANEIPPPGLMGSDSGPSS